MLAVLAFVLHTAAPAVMPVPRARLLVLVRTEGRDGVDDRQMRTITSGVRDIWRPYVDVAFGTTGDLRRTIDDDQLQLVVTDRVVNGSDGSLGWIEFVDGEPARTITVSSGAAKLLVARGSWGGKRLEAWPPRLREHFMTRALARSIAHEIGHYLLRSRTHARKGLMRARFSVDEIMDTGLAGYRLAAAEVKMLERRLLEYAQAPVRSAEQPVTRPPA
jgi:hypothetical protein